MDKSDYDSSKIYSPIISGCVVWYLIMITVYNNFQIVSIDYKTAFLYGEVKNRVLIEVPEGLNYDCKKYVLRLNRSLYGLKTSSRCWFEKLRNEILNLGFIESNVDQCIFSKTKGQKIFIFGIYIDDIIFLGSNRREMDELLEGLKNKFQLKINYDPTCFLGIQICKREDGTIKLHQTNYAD